MAFVLDRKPTVLCYGIMTAHGTVYAEQAVKYGTRLVAGIQPGRGGTKHLGIPVYNNLGNALEKHAIDACIIQYAGDVAAAAIRESIARGIRLIVCTTGSVPSLDMVKIKESLRESGSMLIGPSSLGIIIPGQYNIGVMPTHIVQKGNVGLISRHGSFTFEILNQFRQEGLGISMCISIGSEVVKGMELLDAFEIMNADKNTKAIAILANISGFDEENLAEHYRSLPPDKRKPVVIYMAGSFYDFMGKNTYQEKIGLIDYKDTKEKKEMLFDSGMAVLESPAIIAKTTRKILNDEVYVSTAGGA